MEFSHAGRIWADFPELAAGAAVATGINASDGAVSMVRDRVGRFYAAADAHLAGSSEAELPQTQAWRRAFARMGLKPTQYRCASEALLRRYKKDRSLPSIHPLVDLCNAISLAYAIPVAVIDVDQVAGSLQVRYADGTESYLAFSGEQEQPYAGEVIFADEAGHVHARRWTNRQSALSAVSPGTTTVLIVAEAMHDSASADVAALIATIAAELTAVWPGTVQTGLLRPDQPCFRSRAGSAADPRDMSR
jgi:DNA/RNA-binding domain of Phe-tRNA-synthetase-like protein